MRVNQPLLLFIYEGLDSRQNGILFLCSPTSNDSSTVFPHHPLLELQVCEIGREVAGGGGKEYRYE